MNGLPRIFRREFVRSRFRSTVLRLVPRHRGARAFTLIEMLAVLGLIVILVGGIGFALNDTGGSSLATAQRELASLVGTARAQAAVYSTEARLCVYTTRGDAEKYLRLLQVFRDSTPESKNPTWVAASNPVYLPRGVYLVPSVTTGLVASGVVWPANPAPVSTLTNNFSLPVSAAPVGTPFNGGTSSTNVSWIGYRADGTLTGVPTGAPYAKLALATATLTNGLPQFNNAGAVRGLLLRPSGGVTAVNDANSF